MMIMDEDGVVFDRLVTIFIEDDYTRGCIVPE